MSERETWDGLSEAERAMLTAAYNDKLSYTYIPPGMRSFIQPAVGITPLGRRPC